MHPLESPLRRRDDMNQDPVISGSHARSIDAVDENGRYDHRAYKMVAIVSSRLEPVVAANTVGHMMVALGAETGRQILGQNRQDADGTEHARLAKYPLIILTARPGKIGTIIDEARQLMWVTTVDYPEEGYTTTHDDDYGDALSKKSAKNLTYIGAAIFGPADAVKKICGNLSLWKPGNGS